MKLSVLIPSRSEIYLQNTIDDVLAHSNEETEVIVGLDGWKPDTLKTNDRVKIFASSQVIGQRAMCNRLAELSDAKYLMKLDAHCALSPYFDTKMMAQMEDDVTLIPALAPLNIKEWQIHPKILSKFYFGVNLELWPQAKETLEPLVETMTLQGSGFMCTRDKYWELNLCDEAFGSWGMQATEVACKTWLSGGRLLSTRKAFMGHYFRNKDFPYERNMAEIEKCFKDVKELFLGNKWPLQKRSFQSLIQQFGYPCDWNEAKLEELCAPFVEMTKI